MKYTTLNLCAAIALSSISAANAADAIPAVSNGTIAFEGSIIDSPCSIAPGSLDQVVELGKISSVQLKSKEGRSKPENFEINLEGCEAPSQSVYAIFTGAPTGAPAGMGGTVGITGGSKGASIAIVDGSGVVVTLNKKTTLQQLQAGSNALLFSAYVQGHGPDAEIVAGDFKGVVNFGLGYE